MSLPFRRRSRPQGAARLAPVPGIPASSEADTDVLEHVRPADWDGTTIEFTGASVTGLPDDAPLAHHLAAMPPYEEADIPEPATRPAVMLRTQPPPFSHAGYAATTGPQPAYVRLPPAIGDALTRDDQWGPRLIPLPCGHCGTPPPVPGDILERTRIVGHVNWLAGRLAGGTTWTGSSPARPASRARSGRPGRGGSSCTGSASPATGTTRRRGPTSTRTSAGAPAPARSSPSTSCSRRRTTSAPAAAGYRAVTR